jgi:hypothetical protein
MNSLSFLRSGLIAGALSAFSFTIIHDLFISNIWNSLPVMLVAGAICGLCLGWTYGLLFEAPSIQSWLKYNALFVGMFALIGGVSVLVFEPVTTIPALVAANSPPDHLIKQAMPMTIVSTLLMVAVIIKLYARTWSHYGAIIVTCTVLVLLLGLNVSVIGLVEVPRSSIYLIVELFGLIFALNAVFAVALAGLEWRRFSAAYPSEQNPISASGKTLP